MTREEQQKILLEKFGTCGCKGHCEVEQYPEPSMQDKPGGRYSVCEVEAQDLGIWEPVEETTDDEG